MENSYSYGEYLDLVSKLRREHPDWRTGQAYFNALHRIRADLAAHVRGDVELDPFHNNSNVERFKLWVRKHWDPEDAEAWI